MGVQPPSVAEPYLPPMTPRQRAIFDDVLAIGADRPYAPIGLVAELGSIVGLGTAQALVRWPEPSLWVSKSTLMAVRRCEGGFLASRATGFPAGKTPAAATGDLAHRAIQLAYTHPALPVAQYMEAAVRASRTGDDAFEALWVASDIAAQSDIVMQATSRVTAFLDSWPEIRPSWDPRFEEPLQAKVGKLTLSARADLVLGRPRPSGQQSMVVVDWKSGAVGEQHAFEASYHALVATLSHGVPPFRSLVYSLASGEYTDPRVSAAVLLGAAEAVAATVTDMVDLLTERRAPRVRCEQRWCASCGTLTPAQVA